MDGALSKEMLLTMVCLSISHFYFFPLRVSIDKAAEILTNFCMRVSTSIERPLPAADNVVAEASTWLLKANVTVYRHADRTPKQKLKLYAHQVPGCHIFHSQ